MKADIQKSRAAALLLALCLIAVFSLSALFVVSHADHDCTGTDCAVCHEIHSCLSALRHISEGLGPSAHYGLGAMLLLLCALLPVSLSDRRSCTLPAVKIRLNHSSVRQARGVSAHLSVGALGGLVCAQKPENTLIWRLL